MMPENLKKMASKAAIFLTAQTLLIKILFILKSIILARLLSPRDFGLIYLAMVLIQSMNSLTSVGINKYLIQKKTLDNETVGNAWSLNMIRGLLLTLISLILCPVYGKLVHEPATIELLRIVAFIPLIEGFKNPGLILAERNVRFGLISIYETVYSILEVIVVIILAWLIKDVRALAWGLIISAAFKMILSFVFFPVPGAPKFMVASQKELLSVAKHFVVISVGTLIMVQGDNLIVGALIGSDKLGLYIIAYQLAVFPVVLLQQVINRIALPVFSTLQSDKKRLGKVVANIMQIQLSMIIPFAIVLGIFAQDIIVTLYGNKWLAAAPVLQCLMLVTLGKGLTHVCVPYIIGIGAFGFASRMKFFETLVFLGGVYVGVRHFGLTGAALGAGVAYMIAGVGRLIFICRKNKFALTRVAFYIFLPSISVIPGVCMVLYLIRFLSWPANIETIAGLIMITLIYMVISIVFQKNLVQIIISAISLKTYDQKYNGNS